jgi:3-oxoacyl-[acyl-carrier protein] reductase
MVAEAGEVDLLVANAGVSEGHARRPSWEIGLDEWWQIFEVNVLGVHLCCRAVILGMLERGRGRIVITGSGAAYLPGGQSTAYAPSKAAVCRYGEMLGTSSPGASPSSSSAPVWCRPS